MRTRSISVYAKTETEYIEVSSIYYSLDIRKERR